MMLPGEQRQMCVDDLPKVAVDSDWTRDQCPVAITTAQMSQQSFILIVSSHQLGQSRKRSQQWSSEPWTESSETAVHRRASSASHHKRRIRTTTQNCHRDCGVSRTHNTQSTSVQMQNQRTCMHTFHTCTRTAQTKNSPNYIRQFAMDECSAYWWTHSLKRQVCSLAYELVATWRWPSFTQMTRVNSAYGFVDSSTLNITMILLSTIIIIMHEL